MRLHTGVPPTSLLPPPSSAASCSSPTVVGWVGYFPPGAISLASSGNVKALRLEHDLAKAEAQLSVFLAERDSEKPQQRLQDELQRLKTLSHHQAQEILRLKQSTSTQPPAHPVRIVVETSDSAGEPAMATTKWALPSSPPASQQASPHHKSALEEHLVLKWKYSRLYLRLLQLQRENVHGKMQVCPRHPPFPAPPPPVVACAHMPTLPSPFPPPFSWASTAGSGRSTFGHSRTKAPPNSDPDTARALPGRL